MNNDERVQRKLESATRECRLHLERLNHARGKLESRFPLSVEDWNKLDDDTIANLDQLLFRFGRLQDTMGQRLFKYILEIAMEWDESEPFIDKLARLERMNVLPSSEQWLTLRELRNSAMHEYPDQPELNVANLNTIHQAISALEEAFNSAIGFAESRLRHSG